jgi:hypothetical protein
MQVNIPAMALTVALQVSAEDLEDSKEQGQVFLAKE